MSSKTINYSSIGRMLDGAEFCSAVEARVENILEDSEEDAVVIYPSASGWATTRSESYRWSDQDAELILPYPIYKIKKVYLNMEVLDLWTTEGGSFFISQFKNEKGESLKKLDITKYFVEEPKWNALSQAAKVEAGEIKEYLTGIYKDNTFFWKEGDNKILFLSTVYKKGNWFFDGFDGVDDSPVWERLFRSALYNVGADYRYKKGDTDESLQYMAAHADYALSEWFSFFPVQIHYIPLFSKTKIRARKNEKCQEEYIQPFNQRAEINAASAFGKNMYLTAQKTGVGEIAVVKNYKKLSDIPPLGALVNYNGIKYRLTANRCVMTNTVFLQVIHTLSEKWSNRSKHISVDQKYRNWSIPQDILWRNLYWEDFLFLSKEKKTYPSWGSVKLEDIARGLKTASAGDKTVSQFCWYPEDEGWSPSVTTAEGWSHGTLTNILGATVPCIAMGMGNSMFFTGSFKDHLSAGLCRPAGTDIKKTQVKCSEVPYCKQDGTLKKAKIILTNGLTHEGASSNEIARGAYPAIIEARLEDESVFKANHPYDELGSFTLEVLKDPGEALKFTYQIHLTSEGDCFFGNRFAQNNPLVRDWNGANRTFLVWLCKEFVREGSDRYEGMGSYYMQAAEGLYFTISEMDENKDVCEIALTDETTKNIIEGYHNAWVITDEQNNIYLGCNDINTTKLYLQLSHTR